jgi:hypothetical protein
MPLKLLENFSGKFAEQWVTALLTPAFAFWVGGFIALIQHQGWRAIATHGKQSTQISESNMLLLGWQSLAAPFSKYPEPLQIAILISCFCAIALSAFIVQRFDLTVLRFLEGYWHPWLRPLQKRLTRREKTRLHKIETRLAALAQRHVTSLSTDEKAEYTKLDWQLMHMPSAADQLMPTRLGNILRATERRPSERYGLDAIICWSRLWLLLPDTTRKDLQEARAELNTAARLWLWSLLFSVWTFLGAWWAFPIGAIAAWFTYYVWILDAANTYADLVDAAFDIHRTLLYKSLRWQLPATAAAEIEAGKQLTEYLWNGSDSDTLQFVQPQKE